MSVYQCIEPSCDQPRYVLATGHVLPRCPDHHRAFARRRDAQRRQSDEVRRRHNELSVESKQRARATPEGRERMRENNRRGKQAWNAKPDSRERDNELRRQSYRRIYATPEGRERILARNRAWKASRREQSQEPQNGPHGSRSPEAAEVPAELI